MPACTKCAAEREASEGTLGREKCKLYVVCKARQIYWSLSLPRIIRLHFCCQRVVGDIRVFSIHAKQQCTSVLPEVSAFLLLFLFSFWKLNAFYLLHTIQSHFHNIYTIIYIMACLELFYTIILHHGFACLSGEKCILFGTWIKFIFWNMIVQYETGTWSLDQFVYTCPKTVTLSKK